MKKISTLLVLTFLTLAVSAKNPPSKIAYQGEVLVGYSLGLGATDRINIHSINGITITDRFFLGLGIGLDVIPEVYENTPELLMPIYLNAKVYFPSSKAVSLFVSADIGGSVGVTAGVTGISGFLITPAVGISIKTPKNPINISLGYNYQGLSAGILSASMSAISLKLSYQF